MRSRSQTLTGLMWASSEVPCAQYKPTTFPPRLRPSRMRLTQMPRGRSPRGKPAALRSSCSPAQHISSGWPGSMPVDEDPGVRCLPLKLASLATLGHHQPSRSPSRPREPTCPGSHLRMLLGTLWSTQCTWPSRMPPISSR